MKIHEQIIENHTNAVMVVERIFHRKPDMKFPQDIAGAGGDHAGSVG